MCFTIYHPRDDNKYFATKKVIHSAEAALLPTEVSKVRRFAIRIRSLGVQQIFITLKSHDRNGVLNHRKLDCIFISLYKLTVKDASKISIAGPDTVNFPDKKQ